MTIEAMKQALEDFMRIRHHFDTDEYAWEISDHAITSLRQAIKQAEKQVCVGCEGNPQGENIPCAVCGAAPQPQREWVGLTDDELRDLEKQFEAERVRTSDEEYLVIYPAAYWQWQRAIEAKLKEKNI